LRRRYRRVKVTLHELRTQAQSSIERRKIKRVRHLVRKLFRHTIVAMGGVVPSSFSSFSSSSSSSLDGSWTAYSTVSSTTLSDWGYDGHLSTPELANRLYQKLVSRLSGCPVGEADASKACRRRVMRKFRKVLHAREKAMIKLLRWRARAQLGRAMQNCDLTTASNPSARNDCITAAQNFYVVRLQRLRQRALDANKRNALRVCETSADVSACTVQAENAYNNDLSIANAECVTQAAALVQQLQSGAYSVSADPFASLITLNTIPTPAPQYSSESFLI